MPSGASAGRGSIGGGSRFTSNRPRMEPRGPRAAPAWGLVGARGPSIIAARRICVTSEPEDHLAGQEAASADAAAVPAAVPEGGLQEQVAQAGAPPADP